MANPEWTDPADWEDSPSETAMFDEGMAAGIEWAACVVAECARDGTDPLERLRKGAGCLPTISGRIEALEQRLDQSEDKIGIAL